MAGAVGAGGIGNVAIAYGFNRYNHDKTILATIIIILIIFKFILNENQRAN